MPTTRRSNHHGVTDPQGVQVTPDIEGDDVRLVTISMGGNDAGFARVLKRCFLRRCLTQPYEDLDGKEYPSLDAWARERLPRIRQDLIVVYKRLRASFPNARILVLGYPALLPLVEPPFGRDPGWVCHTILWLHAVGGWDADERAAVQDWGIATQLPHR
jgi:hypothetical protein